MRTFKEFLEYVETPTDESQIDRIYKKAHTAVQIVKDFSKEILHFDIFKNISTIANLGSGAYGVYISSENKKILSPQTKQKLKYYGNIDDKTLNLIPMETIIKYYPDIKPEEIKVSDTIHVNVLKHLTEAGSDLEAIREIASTIIHEAWHELGHKEESEAIGEEKVFKNWFDRKTKELTIKYPDLIGDTVGAKGIRPKIPI